MAKQFTRNYDNLFVSTFAFDMDTTASTTTDTPNHEKPYFRTTNGSYVTTGATAPYVKSIQDASVRIYPPTTYGVSDESFSGATACYPRTSIQLGSGSTTPSYDDYCLHTPFTANMSLGTVSTSTVYDPDTHIYTRTHKIPILYSGSEPITVTEYGIFTTFCRSTSKLAKTLVYRETLDTPVTLEQNDTIEITFSQSIMQPNYTEYPATE